MPVARWLLVDVVEVSVNLHLQRLKEGIGFVVEDYFRHRRVVVGKETTKNDKKVMAADSHPARRDLKTICESAAIAQIRA